MKKQEYDVLMEVVKEVFRDPEMFATEEALRKGMEQTVKIKKKKRAAQTLRSIRKTYTNYDCVDIINAILYEHFNVHLDTYCWHDVVQQIKALDAEETIVQALAARLQCIVKNGLDFTITNIIHTLPKRPYRGFIQVNINSVFFSQESFMEFVKQLHDLICKEHEHQVAVAETFNTLVSEICNKKEV